MLRLVALVAAALLSISTAVNVKAESPIAKVITLLEDLIGEVEGDGKDEAKAYSEYACFCKDTNKEKSTSITKGQGKIDSLSADIAKNTATKEKKEAEIKEREEKHEELGASLTAEVTRCSKANADYEATKADMEKAILSLEKAIAAMNGKKSKAGGASLIEMPEDVAHGLALADAMDLLEAKQRQMIGSFVQGAGKVDPKDPAYKYHSKEINELLAKLEKQFNDDKDENQKKWDKIEKACDDNKKTTAGLMKTNLDKISKLKIDVKGLEKTIADDRDDLIEAQDQLKDDEIYLKDLTAQCSQRAIDWDQRSQMRADELTALNKAKTILTDDAKSNYKDSVDKEGFLQMVKKVEDDDKEIRKHSVRSLAFLQTEAQDTPVRGAFLDKKAVTAGTLAAKEQVLDLLRVEGNKLASPMLSSLAMQVARQQDPYKSVKKLIQGLIEKLLDEAKAEASKQGFCTEELAKAQKDRDYAMAKAKVLGADLATYEAKKEELEEEIKDLKKDIKDIEKDLKKAKKLQDEDHDANVETLKKANEGLEAVKEAVPEMPKWSVEVGGAVKATITGEHASFFNLEDILPMGDTHPGGDMTFYNYEGSLTQPPCTEGVTWWVSAEPVEAEQAQIQQIRRAIIGADSTKHGNNRVTQPLNGRKVLVGHTGFQHYVKHHGHKAETKPDSRGYSSQDTPWAGAAPAAAA